MNTVSRIRKRAKEKGKTLKSICLKLGYNGRTYFSDIDNKGGTIPDDKLEIIAHELDTTVAYLKGESDEKEKTAQESGTISIRSRDGSVVESELSDAQIEIVKRMIEQFNTKS